MPVQWGCPPVIASPAAAGEGRGQQFQHFLGALDQCGPFTDQPVAARCAWVEYRAGQGTDFTARLGSQPCGDQGAGALRGLDHHRRQRQPGHQAVARGEVAGRAGVPGRYSLSTAPSAAIRPCNRWWLSG